MSKENDNNAKKAVRTIMYRNLEGDIEELLSYVERIEKQRDEAQQRVREWNKDSEIQRAEGKVQAAYKQLSKGFAPTDNQWEQIDKWEKKHAEKHHKAPNYQNYSYSFEYTPLGTFGDVVCTVCAAKAMKNSLGNISRYEELIKKYDARFLFGEV